MTIEVDVQRATRFRPLPGVREFRRWVEAALEARDDAEVSIRIVGSREMRRLNRRYRDQDRPTNVLSFPAELPAGVDLPLLGDVVLCAPVIAGEAAEQGKTAQSHWAHLTVHGVLHLLGHDHQEPADARRMEGRELAVLAQLGFPDPYR